MLTQRDGLLGWATGRLVIHDTNAPGVIRRLLSSGPMRRQAVFAAIALELASERHDQIVGCEPDEVAAKAKAEVLRDGRARQVVAVAIGRDVPDGLLGAFERVGLAPLQRPPSYVRLIEALTAPDQSHIADALRYVGQINDMTLRIADVLPAWLVHPEALRRLDSIADARGFVGAVATAQAVNSRLTHEAFRQALTQMRDQTALADVVARFIRRADHPLAVPVPADDDVTPLLSVRQMVLTSRQFRNCMATDRKIIGALLARTAYAVLRGAAVMEFVALSDGAWLYGGAYGVRNAQVDGAVEELALAKCTAAGVPYLRPSQPRRGQFVQFTDPYDPRLIDFAA